MAFIDVISLHIIVHAAMLHKPMHVFRYPKPGPRAEAWNLKVFMYGYAYIQDMIEHGVIRLQTGLSRTVGVVAQQFPYPCYTEDK